MFLSWSFLYPPAVAWQRMCAAIGPYRWLIPVSLPKSVEPFLKETCCSWKGESLNHIFQPHLVHHSNLWTANSSHGSVPSTQIAWSSRAVENPNQLKVRPQNGSLKEAARISWTLASWDMIKLISRLTESGMIQCHAVGCECGRPCVSCLRRHAAALRQLPTPCVSFRRV